MLSEVILRWGLSGVEVGRCGRTPTHLYLRRRQGRAYDHGWHVRAPHLGAVQLLALARGRSPWVAHEFTVRCRFAVRLAIALECRLVVEGLASGRDLFVPLPSSFGLLRRCLRVVGNALSVTHLGLQPAVGSNPLCRLALSGMCRKGIGALRRLAEDQAKWNHVQDPVDLTALGFCCKRASLDLATTKIRAAGLSLTLR